VGVSVDIKDCDWAMQRLCEDVVLACVFYCLTLGFHAHSRCEFSGVLVDARMLCGRRREDGMLEGLFIGSIYMLPHVHCVGCLLITRLPLSFMACQSSGIICMMDLMYRSFLSKVSMDMVGLFGCVEMGQGVGWR